MQYNGYWLQEKNSRVSPTQTTAKVNGKLHTICSTNYHEGSINYRQSQLQNPESLSVAQTIAKVNCKLHSRTNYGQGQLQTPLTLYATQTTAKVNCKLH
jgi:hypothetical protein